jgi:type VI secretion system secreted protein VgrG
VQIQAQDDAIEAIAKKDVQLASTAGDIDFAAAKSIKITAGGCQVEIGNGQIRLKAPGPVNIHGSVKNLTGPATANPVLPHLPQGEIRPSDIEFRYAYHDGEPVKAASYKAVFADGTTKTGVLDADGYARIEHAPTTIATVIFGKDPRPFEKFKYQAKPDEELDDWLNK